jgi:dTDP-4-amino-4,6-dideoxygalactose transaminase
MIPYGRQSIDDDDIAAVVDVLRGDWLTQGPEINAFEADLATRVGAAHAVAFSSGTAALHAACAAAGLGPGDLLGTSALTFNASAACARYVGADVRILDIDPATLNVDPTAVPDGLEALVAVHYAGLPIDLRHLEHRPRIVIEDAAHAIGAQTPDGPVGSCAHSDMTCFSFHPVKTITTAEGGAVTTNSEELAHRLRRFRNHGIEPNPDAGGWAYEVVEVAPNYRITDLQAALGRSQLRRVPEFLDRRDQIVARYRAALAEHPVVLPPEAPDGFRHGRHLFPVQVLERRRIYEELRAAGIGVQVHYVPLYLHPIYRGIADAADFPCTQQVYDGLLSLPLFPALSDDDQDRVVETLTKLL